MGRDTVRQNATPAEDPTPSQMRAVAALAGGATTAAAAAAAGVDRSTVYRWLGGDAGFVAELNRARRDQADVIRCELRELATDAVKALRNLIRSEEVPAGVRLRAAMAALAAAGGRSPEPFGPTEPEEVRAQWARDERGRAKAERLQELLDTLD